MMEAGDLLVGNLAIASVVIKTLISGLRQAVQTSPLVTRLTAIGLGIGTSFIMDAGMYTLGDAPTAIAVILNKVIAGMFIGVTAIGVNEAAKQIVKK